MVFVAGIGGTDRPPAWRAPARGRIARYNPGMATCLISLGANLGDPVAQMQDALARLAARPEISDLAVSRMVQTAPVGGPAGQPPYVNAAARFSTTLPPEKVLAKLLEIEQSAGRKRDVRWGPRTLDLDLLLYGDLIVDTGELVLPHPRLAVRRFVLGPAVEIAAEMRHPVLGWSLARVLEHLDSSPAYAAVVGPPASGKTDLCLALSKAGVAEAILDRVDPTLPARLDSKPTTALPAVERILHTGRAQRLAEKSWPARDSQGRPSRVQAIVSDFWIGQGPGYIAGWGGGRSGSRPAEEFDAETTRAEGIVTPRMIFWLDAPAEWSAAQIAARKRPSERRLDAAWCERFRAGLVSALRRAECPVVRIDARDAPQAAEEAAAAILGSAATL